MSKYLKLVLPLLIAACGSSPVERQPLPFEQVRSADADARKALKNGELFSAQNDFAKVLSLQQSLDDTTGAATTLINLATVTHQLGDDESALKWLDRLLLEKEDIYPKESRLTAAFRKAVILANHSRLDEAESSLQDSEKICSNKCPLKQSMRILRARIALLRGDAEQAISLAQDASKSGGDGKEEHANALRVIASAEEKLERAASALQHYQAALEIDKRLGLSERISEDLNGMARVSEKLGQSRQAGEYSRRAALVKDAIGQVPGTTLSETGK